MHPLAAWAESVSYCAPETGTQRQVVVHLDIGGVEMEGRPAIGVQLNHRPEVAEVPLLNCWPPRLRLERCPDLLLKLWAAVRHERGKHLTGHGASAVLD